MNKWLFGIPYEIAFWDATYSKKRELKSVLNFDHYGQQIQLAGFDVVSFLEDQPTDAIVLDVGCGMTFRTGDYFLHNGEKQLVNIHYVDPLAHYYNKIAKKYKVQVPEVEFGMMEYLSAFYPQHDVSLVVIQNALDHSSDPLKGILQALNALKIGGVLYLNHHPNEAEYEHYRGFHQFNIMVENDELIIWNKTVRYNVTQIVAAFASVKTVVADGNPIAILTKEKNVPAEFIDADKDIRTLSEALLAYSECVNSPAFMFRYHAKFAYYQIGQRAAKLFSWQTRQKIKKWLKL